MYTVLTCLPERQSVLGCNPDRAAAHGTDYLPRVLLPAKGGWNAALQRQDALLL